MNKTLTKIIAISNLIQLPKDKGMFGYVALAIIAFFFIFISEVTFIIFGGVLISLILLGILGFIRPKIPGSKNLLLVMTILAVVLATVGVGWMVSSKIAKEIEVFLQQLPLAFQELMESLRQNLWFDRLRQEAEQGDWVENFIAPKVLPKTAKIATVLLNGATGFGIALLLGVYFAVDSKRYGKGLEHLTPRDQNNRYRDLAQALHDNLQSWLMGKLFSMIAVGVLTYVGLLLLGIKAAFPLAVIAGFLGFIPNVGPIMSAVPAIIIAFAEGWKMCIYVGILYMAIQAAEGAFITPIIQKRKVKLLPAALITFQFVMAILFGFGGLFMATPILVALMTVIDEFWIKNPNR